MAASDVVVVRRTDGPLSASVASRRRRRRRLFAGLLQEKGFSDVVGKVSWLGAAKPNRGEIGIIMDLLCKWGAFVVQQETQAKLSGFGGCFLLLQAGEQTPPARTDALFVIHTG